MGSYRLMQIDEITCKFLMETTKIVIIESVYLILPLAIISYFHIFYRYEGGNGKIKTQITKGEVGHGKDPSDQVRGRPW